MTNQQGAPEGLEDHQVRKLAAIGAVSTSSGLVERRPIEYRRELENQFVRGFRTAEKRLAALVEAQQPAPSAAAAGFAMVPVDATDAMMAAFAKAAAADVDWHGATEVERQEVRDGFGPAYRAMLAAAPQPSPTPQADSQPAPDLDIAVMQLAESVGLIGPASRVHDLHAAIQRFHDLICVNATIKAAVMAADAIRGAARAPADSVLEDAMAWPKPGPQNPTWTICPKFLEKIMRSSASEYMPGLEEVEAVLLGLRTLISASRVDLPGWESWPPTAQTADSVLEDAARLDWLDQQCEGYGFQDIHEGNRWEISGAYANVREAIDAERAARKQGANLDNSPP